MESSTSTRYDESLSLEYLMTLWPVAESLATHLPVGDLITLSRTNKDLRAGLHGGYFKGKGQSQNSDTFESVLVPDLGEHQTAYWKHLKKLSPFMCVNKIHTKGQKLKPCVYCSRPICDACIVRDSFKKGKEDTFKNRLRCFCRECWIEGKPTQTHRYLGASTDHSNEKHYKPGLLGKDLPSNDTDNFCSCTLKDNGWLCIECKDWQNNFYTSCAGSFMTPIQTAQCYALNCRNQLDQNPSTRDRQRICLWCQKPLRRQYGGEDRHAWNQKTVTARAINAESRSRDIEEYNRKRWRSLRMSRNEMRRGNGGIDDNRLEFVRHLDTVNYLGTPYRLSQKENPSPDSVYKSKNGVWQYQRGFLLAFGRVCRHKRFQLPGLNVEAFQEITVAGALRFARTNKMIHDDLIMPNSRHAERAVLSREAAQPWITLRTRIINLVIDLTHEEGIKGHEADICTNIADQYGLQLTEKNFKRLWEIGQKRHQATGPNAAGEEEGTDRSAGESQSSRSQNDPSTEPNHDIEVDEGILAGTHHDNPATSDENTENTTTQITVNTAQTQAESPLPTPPGTIERLPATTLNVALSLEAANEDGASTAIDRISPSDEPPSYLP